MEQNEDMGPIFTNPEDQARVLLLKQHECISSLANNSLGADMCPQVWDSIACWPSTLPGKEALLSCPSYIAGFDHQATASRYCTSDSTWFVSQEHNRSWTNYSMCYKNPLATVVIKFADVANVSHTTAWMPILKPAVHVGFGFSLLSLLIAFGILATTKKLRCPRNTLHMHLFASFILRASMGLLKDSLFVEGVGLSSDVVIKGNDTYFQQERNWACKCLTSVWHFTVVANYSWILMEGLYLHNLIFLALFSDSSAITLHVVLGWGLPMVVVVAWVLVRASFENDFCWTTQNSNALLVIKIPIVISILINFVFFLNIVRVLFLKLKSSISEETRRYRKWARSTLVLVPLFGVQYTLFLALSFFTHDNPNLELFWLFGDQITSAFQGFCVAVLYCFLNAEVRSEMTKKWTKSRWHQRNPKANLNRNSSRGWRLRWSRSSYVTSNVSIECRKMPSNEPGRLAACVPLCEQGKRDTDKKCACEEICNCDEERAVIEI